MFFKKRIQKEAYDKENTRPVIRASICTGEQVAGFKDIRTGKFTEVMLLRTEADKQIFLKKYNIAESAITKEW